MPTRAYSRAIPRRRFVGGAAAGVSVAGLTALGIACGSDSDGSPTATRPPGGGVATSTPALATPSSTARRGGIANIVSPETGLAHLDLHRLVTAAIAQAASLSHNRLFRHAAGPSVAPTDYEIVGDLAESSEQPDELTLTVHLKKGVKWQNVDPVNGREFVANDVVKSFERQASDGAEYVYAYFFDWIDSITAVDDHTLVFKAVQPTFRGLATLAMREMPIFAPESIEKFGNLEGVQAWAGTGPFILKKWVPEVGFTFERNPDYFEQGLPHLDGVNFNTIPDASARLAAFLAGEIDQIEGIAHELVDTVKKSRPDATVSTFSSVGGSHFAWKGTPDSPFHDPRVRKAWSLITDRRGLSSALEGDATEIRVSPVSPGFTQYARPQEDIIRDDVVDITEAKRLMTEAGFPDGFQSELNGGTTSVPWIEWAVQRGKLIGLDLIPNPVERAVYVQAQRDHNYRWGGVYGIRAYDDPDEYLYPLFHSGASKNYFDVADPELDRLIIKQRTVLDFEERKEVLQEIDRRWTTDFNHHTFATTLFRNDAIGSRLKNHAPRVVNEFSQLRYAWIEDA